MSLVSTVPAAAAAEAVAVNPILHGSGVVIGLLEIVLNTYTSKFDIRYRYYYSHWPGRQTRVQN